MDISQIDDTSEFLDGQSSKNLNGAKRKTVDLNEAPFKIQEEHLIRLKTLSRTGNDFYMHQVSKSSVVLSLQFTLLNICFQLTPT